MPARPAFVATGSASTGALFESIFPPRSDRTLPRRECIWGNPATDLGTGEEEIRMTSAGAGAATNVGVGVTTIDGVGVIIGGDDFLEDRGPPRFCVGSKRGRTTALTLKKWEIEIAPNSFYGC